MTISVEISKAFLRAFLGPVSTDGADNRRLDLRSRSACSTKPTLRTWAFDGGVKS
jgi:hypothetical protein